MYACIITVIQLPNKTGTFGQVAAIRITGKGVNVRPGSECDAIRRIRVAQSLSLTKSSMSQHFGLMRNKRLPGFRALASIGLLAGVTALSGCQLDKISGNTAPQGLIQFINAAPRYSTVNLFVDDTSALSRPQPYDSGSSVYVNALTNARKFRVTAGTDTTTIASTQLLVQNLSVYAMIVTQHATGAGLLILPDTVSPLPSGQVGLRVINASPSAGPVDFYLTSADSTLTTPVATNITFEGTSGYILAPVPAGILRLRVTAAGTKNVLLDVDASSLTNGQARSVLLMDAAGGGLPVSWLAIPDRG